jgi:hypothetical protein
MGNEAAMPVEVEPTLKAEIKKAQLEDEKLKKIRQLIKLNKTSDFTEDDNGTLWLGKWICIPNLEPIRGLILWEAQDSAYSIHPDSTKMYKYLKTRYWWYEVISCSEIAGTKPPYVCPGCFIHTYSNNMINKFHV